MAYQRGFQPSTPVGQGRGPVRSSMANDTFKYSLKDRMAARRADKALAGATGTAPGKPQGGASFSRPTTVGFTGLQPSQAATTATSPIQNTGLRKKVMGLADTAAKMHPSGIMGGALPNAVRSSAQAATGGKTTGNSTARKINRYTGMPMGTLPGDPDYEKYGGNARVKAELASAGRAGELDTAPKFGKEVAKANIASMGQEGTTADYFKRAEAEKPASFKSKFKAATAMTPQKSGSKATPMPAPPLPVAAKPITPIPSPPKEVKPMMVGGSPMKADYGARVSPEDQAKRSESDAKRREISRSLIASRQPTPQPSASPAVESTASKNLRIALGDTSNDRFVDPVAEAKKAQADASARAAKNNEAIRKRRKAQSTGIFPPDSVAGAAWQWLQNDNFSGAEKQSEKPKKPSNLREKAKSLAAR